MDCFYSSHKFTLKGYTPGNPYTNQLTPGPSEDNIQQRIKGHKYYPKFVEFCSFFKAKISLFLSPPLIVRYSKVWVHKYWVPHCPGNYILHGRGVFSARLVSCHPSGSYNFEMATKFLENMCTPAMKKPLWSSRVTHTKRKRWQITQYNREAGRQS
jgi:hypothetical protein